MRQREPGETEPDAYDHLETHAAHAAMRVFASTFVEGATAAGLLDAVDRLAKSKHEHTAFLSLDERTAIAVKLTIEFDDSTIGVERVLAQARARGDMS